MTTFALAFILLTLLVSSFPYAESHGNMNYPPSTRQGVEGKTVPGFLEGGGFCEQPWGNETQPFQHNDLNGACMLFSQPSAKQPTAAIIPGPPTLNGSRWRTVNVDVSSGPTDWTRIMPWRAPGSALVLGSGCGVAGGGDMWQSNGGWPPRGMAQGADPLATLPKGTPTKWPAGSNQTVAFGIWANHGGGYSYRLCHNEPGQVTEACFQRMPLRFVGETQVLRHINGTEFEIPAVRVDEGTFPSNSQWTRIPFPECADATPCTDAPQKCQTTHGLKDICDEFAYAEPLPNTHGFGYSNDTRVMDGFHDYSVVDLVAVPVGLPKGEYLLSWRWDCEQTTQIWQNCADVLIA